MSISIGIEMLSQIKVQDSFVHSCVPGSRDDEKAPEEKRSITPMCRRYSRPTLFALVPYFSSVSITGNH